MSRTKRIAGGWLAALALAAGAIVVGAGGAMAQCGMHSGQSGHKMDEHRGAGAPTAADVADAIEDYVREDAGLKGGYFLIYDPESQELVALRLERVHEDRLGRVDGRTYFACVEFEGPVGGPYDLDFFVQGPDREHLEVAEIVVHAQNGVARHAWHEEDGFWKKSRVALAESDAGRAATEGSDRLEITVDGAGFHPNRLSMRFGTPTVLVVTRTTDRTCAEAIVIPALDIERELPLAQPVEIVIRPDRKGDIPFSCGMNMMSGTIHVE